MIDRDVAEQLKSLSERITKLDEHFDLRFEVLETRVGRIETRNNQGGGAGFVMTPDHQRILDFLRALPNGVKTNSGTIALNLNMTTNVVTSRLETLVRRKLVQSTPAIKGSYAAYWVDQEPTETAKENKS